VFHTHVFLDKGKANHLLYRNVHIGSLEATFFTNFKRFLFIFLKPIKGAIKEKCQNNFLQYLLATF